MTTPSKKMSLLGLTTLVTINMMGSGIIMLPASMAQLGCDFIVVVADHGGGLDGDRIWLCPMRRVLQTRRGDVGV